MEVRALAHPRRLAAGGAAGLAGDQFEYGVGDLARGGRAA